MQQTVEVTSVGRIVVKIGTSSITDDEGALRESAVEALCDQVARIRTTGCEIVIVTSGAIGCGLPLLGLGGDRRPRDAQTLQAVSAVGQSRLMEVYNHALGTHGLLAGQVLLAPHDFGIRSQYLHARGTLERLLSLGVVPVVNENDAVADDEIRFGDNDRLAALVAQLVGADLLVLLTDQDGLLTADPRVDSSASLIEEIVQVDRDLADRAGGAGTDRGSGGMASKLAAAHMASWSGVTAVIAGAHRPGVLAAVVAMDPGSGTRFPAREQRLSARQIWIGFAVPAAGTIVVDAGAELALVDQRRSLLAAGVESVVGTFEADDAVEIAGPEGVFAKGLSRLNSSDLAGVAGRRSEDLPEGVPRYVVHRDDLVVLPAQPG